MMIFFPLKTTILRRQTTANKDLPIKSGISIIKFEYTGLIIAWYQGRSASNIPPTTVETVVFSVVIILQNALHY